MKFIIFLIVLSQCCSDYYNKDLLFDFTTTSGNNITIGDNKQLFINLCGSSIYQCVEVNDKMEMVLSDSSGQSVIETHKDECEVQSKQKGVSENQMALIDEHNPFLGVLVQLIGVDDEEDITILITCSDSNEIQAATTCAHDYCLLHSSGCPELVSSPIMSFYQDLKVPLGILLMLIGCALLAFGFQFIRFTNVIIAFLLATSFYTIIVGESVLDFDSSYFAIIMIFSSGLGVGIIYANSVYARYLLGLFNLGFAFATFLTLLMENLFLHLFSPSPMFLILSLTITITGTIFGFLACKFVNIFGIGSTASIGAYLLIKPIGWFAGGYPNEIELVKRSYYGFDKRIDYRFYIYLSSMVILIIASVFFQYSQHKKRMNLDQMFSYQDMNNLELQNVGGQVKGFQQEQEMMEQQVQFMKSLSGKEIRSSHSSKDSQ